MPEIKHQFTGGKMNKDLNERIVPNGEYRDALNIQVSTSEGSDVGAVQNILGNSLISGQDFIDANAVCVGSIADEKNDKLYYFITNDEELIVNGGFDGDSSNWTLITGWTYANGKIEGNSVVEYKKINQYSLPTNKFVLDREYEISFTVSGYVEGNIEARVYNENGDGFRIRHSEMSANGKYTFLRKVGTINTTDPSNFSRFWIAAGNVDFTGNIDNISIKTTNSAIIEYNSNTNTITPVLVDTVGDVLKFNPNNIITGINIIDDMLFWTDNHSEPKKININRCKEGTDLSGVVHTGFINDKRDGPFGLIKEEHITVIKKSPTVAPTIELISERLSGGTYSGVMRITSQPNIPFTEQGGNDDLPNGAPGDGGNYLNNSSMWLDDASWLNHYHDFTSITVGKQFDTQIETKLDGTTGFTLNWLVGDTIVFKAFEGDNYDQVPGTPITDYQVKAKIVNASPYPIFTDRTITEEALNGDLILPSDNGNGPRYYSYGNAGIVYSPSLNRLNCAPTINYAKITSTNAPAFDTGSTYTVSIVVSNHTQGRIGVRLFGAASKYWWDGSRQNHQAGLQTHTWVIDTSDPAYGTWQNSGYDNKFHIEFTDFPSTVGFEGSIESISITRPGQSAAVRCEVLAINNPPIAPEILGELRFAVDRLDTQEKLFEFKLPRFAYRYQYEDREYSTISPFSSVAFLPGSFDYHPKKGYNLGMTNRVTSIGIKEFKTNVPDGVIAIDILYKDEVSPSIYIVDTIKPKHNPISNGVNVWSENEFIVTSEQISQMLPSNQSLRSWDAVPKKALAQDISGSRIVYGNYTQGFDLKAGSVNSSEEYSPDFNFNIFSNPNTGLNPKKSIKSLREYQLGVVFVDEYGRETPVISNASGTHKLDKLEAENINQLQVDFNNNKYPENMKYFKFFIKETSGEYYNLAMDRHYDAEDGQVWLSFPSSDRNKLDIDTFLILKKGVESNEMVSAEAKYKVLDIQSQAPDFIKLEKQLIVNKTHVFALDNIFESGLIDVPLQGNRDFKMNYDQFSDGSGSNLHKIDDDLYVEFTNETNNTSKRYRIAKITTDYIDGVVGAAISVAKYSVQLDKKLGDDVNFITDDTSGLSPTQINDLTIVNIYKYSKGISSKFDGRFFVKINIDSAFSENVSTKETIDTKYRTVLSKKLYYLSSDNSTLHSSALTGQTHGVYSDGVDGSTTYGPTDGFGRFAPFFRNYPFAEITQEYGIYNYNSSRHVGQYRFGRHSDSNKPWLQELAWVTTIPEDPAGGSSLTNGFKRDGTYGNKNNYQGAKVADAHGRGDSDWSDVDRYGVFNSDEEQTAGDVWFIDGGPYAYTTPNDNLAWSDNVAAGPDNGTGMTNGTIDIAMGGIYHSEIVSQFGSIAGFYNIGNSILSAQIANPNYTVGSTENLVSKFYPGQQFRFKEDPSGEIYTIQPVISQSRRLRWQTDNDFQMTDYSGTNKDNYIEYSIQLSPNFSKNWKPTFINSSGGSTVNWNPTGDPGPISNGLKLEITSSSSSNRWDEQGNFPWVGVDDIVGVDKNGLGSHTITRGMILTSHSDGGTANEYTGASGKEYLAVSKIIAEADGRYKIYLTGYSKMLVRSSTPVVGIAGHDIFSNNPDPEDKMIFEQPKMNGYSQYSVNRLNAQNATGMGSSAENPSIMAIGYTLEFVEPIDSESLMPSNPAIWETEPKESTPLDIYYEASGYNAFALAEETKYTTIPVGSLVECIEHPSSTLIDMQVTSVDNIPLPSTLALGQNGTGPWRLSLATKQTLDEPIVGSPYMQIDDHLKITKPDGSTITVTVTGWDASANFVSSYPVRTPYIYVNSNLYGTTTKYGLNWHNCFSFGNGIESNRIRDNFNLAYISNGVKVSTTLDEGHGEEHRSSGLVYSGIYNSNSSINNLNQFIAAEKITKDINPIYGSIQKLKAGWGQGGDLIALCEDRVLKILANKDALFNADGNPQLTSTNNVLGQAIPYSGEYGISKNPESFASEAYRIYFTDKVRGTVMRLSMDGLTPLSNHGMKDWFRDNLKLSTKLIGSYDDRNDEYNITLDTVTGRGNYPLGRTVTFKEDVKGWVSFKSFVPENALSMANDYYSTFGGKLYKHHAEGVNRNNFYGVDYNSSVNVILNDGPAIVKSFHTLGYEGSQSRINVFSADAVTDLSDAQPYNLVPKDGWHVSSIETDKQEGSIHEFIEKEGKWFNYIKGIDSDITSETDFGAFDTQGIGILKQTITSDNIDAFEASYPSAIYGLQNGWDYFNNIMEFDNPINASLQIGDIIYYQQTVTSLGGFNTINANDIIKFGQVTAKTSHTITVDETVFPESPLGTPDPYHGAFILFAKNHAINTSSLLGYFADVKFENNSTEKIELFSVGSEITQSSK